jgi:type IV secretory pathway VirB9-like protein
MRQKHTYLLASFLFGLTPLWGSPIGSEKEPGQPETKTETVRADPQRTDVVTSRLIRYGPRDVVDVKAKLRYTTLIILPGDERILDFTCGDKEYWVVEGVENFAYIKPSKEATRTNLNLITAGGNVYSFVLTEVSGQPDAQPDLKVFVELRETEMVSAMTSSPRFVPAYQIDDYRQQIAMAKEETRETREAARSLIEQESTRFRSSYPLKLRFPYRFKASKRPFNVTSIYHDDKFTYIRANPEEVPALYEIKDGKPNLVHFEFHDGTYVVSKVLSHGYLAIGKEKMNFIREE